MPAQQIQTAPDDDSQPDRAAEGIASDGLPDGERLTLAEMSRIMDVASTLRKERSLVEEQLNIDQIKARLRERLLEAARVSGDPVTEAEVDAAVEQYYDRLHEFSEPPRSWRTMLAHVWVRRGPIVKIAIAVAVAAAVLWGLLFAGVLPGERRDAMQAAQRLSRVEAAVTAIEQSGAGAAANQEAADLLATARAAAERRDASAVQEVLAEVDALSAAVLQSARQLSQVESAVAAIQQSGADAATNQEAANLLAAARAAASRRDAAALEQVLAEAESLRALLLLDYTLRIAAAPGEPSGVERQWTDEQGTRTSGFFVFVEATDASGRPVRVPIRNRETGDVQQVSRWGEQVPEAVFNRLAADKQEDGVLDEVTFGEKQRGQRELSVQILGAGGQPIERMGQITSWD